jgi:hypothetical protein
VSHVTSQAGVSDGGIYSLKTDFYDAFVSIHRVRSVYPASGSAQLRYPNISRAFSTLATAWNMSVYNVAHLSL